MYKLIHSKLQVQLILIVILIVGLFLRLYKLSEFMPFIGDQAWFYFSARDMLLTGHIPLVGIASSHPWLHQGALWTYLLALILWLFHFNPLAPGYFTAILDILTIFLFYKFGSTMFSRRVGIITSLLYATSPYVVASARMPYHTSFIPLFTLLLLYTIYKWIKDSPFFFPLSLFFFAILYNFEIATILLWFPFLIVIIYGIWKKTAWVKNIWNRKIVLLSIIGLIVPMLPMLLYDRTHGYPQTVKFTLWIGYHIARIFGFLSIHEQQPLTGLPAFIPYTLTTFQQILFLPNSIIALVLLVSSFVILTFLIYKDWRKKKNNPAEILLSLFFIIFLAGYLGTRTPSGAYFPLFFPFVFLMVAISFDFLLTYKFLHIFGIVIILLLTFFNSFFLLKDTYFTGAGYGATFTDRLDASKSIIQKANGREYNLKGTGNGSNFESFIMNYEYLTWWLGHPSSKSKQKQTFVISEGKQGVKIEKIVNK